MLCQALQKDESTATAFRKASIDPALSPFVEGAPERAVGVGVRTADPQRVPQDADRGVRLPCPTKGDTEVESVSRGRRVKQDGRLERGDRGGELVHSSPDQPQGAVGDRVLGRRLHRLRRLLPGAVEVAAVEQEPSQVRARLRARRVEADRRTIRCDGLLRVLPLERRAEINVRHSVSRVHPHRDPMLHERVLEVSQLSEYDPQFAVEPGNGRVESGSPLSVRCRRGRQRAPIPGGNISLPPGLGLRRARCRGCGSRGRGRGSRGRLRATPRHRARRPRPRRTGTPRECSIRPRPGSAPWRTPAARTSASDPSPTPRSADARPAAASTWLDRSERRTVELRHRLLGTLQRKEDASPSRAYPRVLRQAGDGAFDRWQDSAWRCVSSRNSARASKTTPESG